MNGPLSGSFGSPKIFANWVQFEIRIGVLTGPPGRQADERGDRRAHALDRLVRGRDLLDVDAGSQVRGHVTPSLVDVLAAQFARAAAPRSGAETRRDVLETGSRTSMRSSSRAQSTTVVSGEAPRTSWPSSCDGPVVEVEHHDVGAQPMRRPDDGAGPVLLTDHLAALLAQDPIHAETHDRPEVSEQDARDRAHWPCPNLPGPPLAAGQRLRGSHSGNPCLPVRSSACRRSPGRRRRPGTSSCASASRPSAVRASSRCRPGRQAVEAEAPVGVGSSVQVPTSGSVTQTSAERLALLVADACRPSGASRATARGGPSDSRVRMVCVRTSGPALERARRTRPRAARRSPATPCTGRRPRSRSPTSRPCPGRCAP